MFLILRFLLLENLLIIWIEGIWRWFDESMLDCCVAPEEIKTKGVPLPKLACLARCNGAHCTLKHADAVTEEEFRRDVIQTMRTAEGYSPQVIIVSYSRPVLNQSGSGHFSPLGAYNSRRDMVLIMDVARFKYPPYWVPVSNLWSAMAAKDDVTGLSRGYFIISTYKHSQSSPESSAHIHPHNHHEHEHSHIEEQHTYDHSRQHDTCPPHILSWVNATKSNTAKSQGSCCSSISDIM